MPDINSGPIPGENFTSDTKNYPWRQPPEFTEIDPALEWLGNKITTFKVANGVLTMAEMGFPLYKISSMILMNGVGEGKWTVDFALVLVGPLTRMVELICISFDVDYDIGIDEEDIFETGTSFKQQEKLKVPESFKLLDEQMPEIKSEAEQQQANAQGGQNGDLREGGFLAMTTPQSQEGPAGKETK